MNDNKIKLMSLVRELDDTTRKEWLIVEDPTENDKEVMRLEWNDDLTIWIDAHQEQIDKGDFGVFFQYRCQGKLR